MSVGDDRDVTRRVPQFEEPLVGIDENQFVVELRHLRRRELIADEILAIAIGQHRMQHGQHTRGFQIVLPFVLVAEVFPEVGGDVLEKECFIDEQRDLFLIERRNDRYVLG